MVFSYPLVSKVGVKGYRTAYAFPSGVFVHLEVMLTALGFLHVDDLPAVSLYYDLRLQRMPFFFPNNTLFDPFQDGLSDFPSHPPPHT
jgi:hypothetical protein